MVGFGEGGEVDLLIDSLPLAFVNCAATLVAVFYIDRLGRRFILLRTLPGVGATMLLIGLGIGLFTYTTDTSKCIIIL